MSNNFPISVTGRLTADPTLVYGSDGTARSDMRLAVDDRTRGPDGAWATRQTVFHQIVAWGALAENAAQALAKGDPVVVAGDLRFRTWDDPETHAARTTSEIRATTIGPDLRLSTVAVDRSARAERRVAPQTPQHQTAPQSPVHAI